jgi:hypothetical protein
MAALAASSNARRRPAGLALFALAGLVAACGGASGAPSGGPSPSPSQVVACPTAGPGARTAALRGSGIGETEPFIACGTWTVDLDWRCPDQASFVTTQVAADDGTHRLGPRGDGPVGMALRSYDGTGRYRIVVTSKTGCSWSIDIIAGKI